jgi:hypothetical protein
MVCPIQGFTRVLLILLAIGFGGLIFLWTILSGFADDWSPTKTSPRRDYVPAVDRELRQAAAGEAQVVPLYPIHSATSSAGHYFYGDTTGERDAACLINMKHALSRIGNALVDRSEHRSVVPTKFLGCNGFARVTPPRAPKEVNVLGAIKRPVGHFCAPIMSDGAYVIWEHAEKPFGHISIASGYPDLTAESVIARFENSEGTVMIGGKDAAHLVMSRSQLAAQTELTPVATLRCDGFDVFQISVQARQWPLISAP